MVELQRRSFYKLSELGKRWAKWGLTEDVLWDMAVDGSLPLSVWYNGWATLTKAKDGDEDRNEVLKGRVGFAGLITIGKDEMHDLLVRGQFSIVEVFVVGDTYRVLYDTYPSSASILSGGTVCTATTFFRSDVLVSVDLVDAVEAKKKNLDAPDGANQEIKPALSLHESKRVTAGVAKDFPRESEVPLRTIKEIAAHCKVHEDTVKTWRKNHNDFPASPPGSGTVTALPSELNSWMIRKGRKKT
ncbi:MAG: hypothetical protein J0665_16380 [Deltaproteobacteria bacterium]|nr:hypothetical protein [Deltaproteobacteria bacterium]